MKRRAAALMAIAMISTGAAGCASQETQIALQRPPIANNQAFRIPYDHALRGSVTIDYISGMSQYSFFFAEANRSQFRPALEQVLDRSGMLARTPAAARYGLQVEFVDLRGSFFGGDFDSRSRAIYRIVERRTGRIVSEQTIDAGFMARYVGLTEEDAAAAYWLTIAVAVGGVAHYVGADDQVKAWRQAYQATLWSTLFAPASLVGPQNFIAGGDFFGNTDVPRPHVLNGDLSTEGYGSRDGRTRGIQADRQMIRQSLAKWVMSLSEEQNIPLAVILPCNDNIEIENIKLELTVRGIPYRGETCHMQPVRIIR